MKDASCNVDLGLLGPGSSGFRVRVLWFRLYKGFGFSESRVFEGVSLGALRVERVEM